MEVSKQKRGRKDEKEETSPKKQRTEEQHETAQHQYGQASRERNKEAAVRNYIEKDNRGGGRGKEQATQCRRQFPGKRAETVEKNEEREMKEEEKEEKGEEKKDSQEESEKNMETTEKKDCRETGRQEKDHRQMPLDLNPHRNGYPQFHPLKMVLPHEPKPPKRKIAVNFDWVVHSTHLLSAADIIRCGAFRAKKTMTMWEANSCGLGLRSPYRIQSNMHLYPKLRGILESAAVPTGPSVFVSSWRIY